MGQAGIRHEYIATTFYFSIITCLALPIAEVQAECWWADVTFEAIESLRMQIRTIVKFIDSQQQAIVYTNFVEKPISVKEHSVPTYQTGFSHEQYRKKVTAYILKHQDHVTIAKLKRNSPLTPSDLESLENMLFGAVQFESRDRFEQVYGKNISLKLFIRKLVGLDRNAAKLASARYLEDGNFSANQIRFVETIIDYLTQNGVMEPGLLYEPPLTDLHLAGIDGLFNHNDAEQIITIVRSFNETVGETFKLAQ